MYPTYVGTDQTLIYNHNENIQTPPSSGGSSSGSTEGNNSGSTDGTTGEYDPNYELSIGNSERKGI